MIDSSWENTELKKIEKYFWENKTFRLIWSYVLTVYFKYRIDVHFIFIYLFKSIAEKYKSYLASLSRWSKDFYLSPGVFHVLFLPNPSILQKLNSLANEGVGSGCAQVSLSSCHFPHCLRYSRSQPCECVQLPSRSLKHTALSAWETLCLFLP